MYLKPRIKFDLCWSKKSLTGCGTDVVLNAFNEKKHGIEILKYSPFPTNTQPVSMLVQNSILRNTDVKTEHYNCNNGAVLSLYHQN